MVDHTDPASSRALRFARLHELPLTTATISSNPFRAIAETTRRIFDRRELLGLLVRRDLKSRYKGSALGFLWSFIRPLTQLLIYYIVVGQFLGVARGIPDFAIYVFAGLTVFGLFSEAVSSASMSVIANQGLVKKVSLPREIFPLASVGAALFNFAVQAVILVVAALILNNLAWGWHLLYAAPATLLVLIYAAAFGILMSALNVYLRDIQYLVEVVLMLAMWASPIVYAWSMVRDAVGPGLLLNLYTSNPVTLAVLAFQKAFRPPETTAQGYPDDLLLSMGIAGLVGLVLLFIAQQIFTRLQGNFAQEL
ncbi:ABC transporter permease [Salinibacterium sp. ZJ77]|uniref:ABC transporter permease n=1 Tax=Salinibacterium sp. ZJ77 TaxID=2708337 RepID=UPI0014246B53|nr:ABC transporter permease [Salinibacterium sp. ZJ77]